MPTTQHAVCLTFCLYRSNKRAVLLYRLLGGEECAVYCARRHFPPHLCYVWLYLSCGSPRLRFAEAHLPTTPCWFHSLGSVGCLHQLYSVSGRAPEFGLLMTATQHYGPVLTWVYVKLGWYCVEWWTLKCEWSYCSRSCRGLTISNGTV